MEEKAELLIRWIIYRKQLMIEELSKKWFKDKKLIAEITGEIIDLNRILERDAIQSVS